MSVWNVDRMCRGEEKEGVKVRVKIGLVGSIAAVVKRFPIRIIRRIFKGSSLASQQKLWTGVVRNAPVASQIQL
ncbi:hypothetical protein PGB90_008273 [Kerria lacca]